MSARTTRKERRREQAREEILEAARTVLLSRGLGGATLAAIAREVQLTKAALYYYFPSKEALFFELIFLGLQTHAEALERVLVPTTSGSEAIEALIRGSTDHYSTRMDQLRLAYLVPQVGAAGAARFTPEMIARVRPFNEMIYGSVAEKIREDQRAGRVDESIDGRRLAFLAHMSVIGMLTVEGLVEVADDAPLIHGHDMMVDELVQTFTARLAQRP